MFNVNEFVYQCLSFTISITISLWYSRKHLTTLSVGKSTSFFYHCYMMCLYKLYILLFGYSQYLVKYCFPNQKLYVFYIHANIYTFYFVNFLFPLKFLPKCRFFLYRHQHCRIKPRKMQFHFTRGGFFYIAEWL